MYVSCADAFGFSLALIIKHISHYHCCTISDEAFSYAQTNATGSAGDDRDAIFEIQS